MKTTTPFPWKRNGPFKSGAADSKFTVEAQDGLIVATLAFGRGDREAMMVAGADADVLAAAPDLLLVVEQIDALIDGAADSAGPIYVPLVLAQRMAAAIAKARGDK